MNNLIESLPLLLAGCLLGAGASWAVASRRSRLRIEALRARHHHAQQSTAQAMLQARRQIGQLQEQIAALQQQIAAVRRREQVAEQREATRAQAIADAKAAVLASTPSLRDGFSETVASLPPNGFADTLPTHPSPPAPRR